METKLQVAGIILETLTNGEGIRHAVFLQGCDHACSGCHNPETWKKCQGLSMTQTDILEKLGHPNKYLKGITITGGEPLLQTQGVLNLLKVLESRGFNIWLYTGYTLEQVKELPQGMEILDHIDVLVDGLYDKENPCYSGYRGSTNQKIIKLR